MLWQLQDTSALGAVWSVIRTKILSAHSLSSQGIGDPKVLNKFGIKVVISLPGVGKNLRYVYIVS